MIIQFQQGCNDSRRIDTHAHTVQYCAAWPAPIITSRYYLSIPIPVSVCSGGLKRGSGANLMIRGLNSHLGSRNSGHTGTAALQYLTMCKYFLSDYAVIFCMFCMLIFWRRISMFVLFGLFDFISGSTVMRS